MKKILALVLALLMLVSCGCGLAPVAEDADVIENADMTKLAAFGQELRVSPTEKAYIRNGSAYANKNWRTINAELGLDTNTEEVLSLKNSSAGFTRQALFTFDVSSFKNFEYKKVFFYPSFTVIDSSMTLYYNVYQLDPDAWSTDTVTWNTKPAEGTLLYEGAVIGGLSAVDLTNAVKSVLSAGKTKLSFLIRITTTGAAGENRINPKTTALIATKADSISSYAFQLVDDETENQAIWDWAEQCFDEWYARYEELKTVDSYDADLIVSDEDEFSKIVYSGNSGFGNWTLENVNKPHPTRTYDALDDLGDYSDYDTVYPMDIYGGWMDPNMQQEATGFFYSKKLGERWYIIDPLGYPCYIRAMSSVGLNYLGSPNQKQAALDKYGTSEKWAIATVRWLKDDLGFNFGRSTIIAGVESTLASQSSIGFLGSYGSSIGVNSSKGGSTVFSENNTMPVFDPGFVTYADTRGKIAESNKDDPWVIGYTTDNELPMDSNMLTNYLTIDYSKPVNHYSYAAAWTWFINMTGKANPTQEDIDDELMQIFMGFVWDRYYNVVTTAFRKYDPNHMMLGTRFLTKVKNSPWVLRFASLYLDCMTINWYGQWEPNADDLYAIAQNVNLPIMITEFYTKALENDGSFDNPADPLKNTRGAGWIVRTQQDRGDFYQNFTLRLIESKNVIGWHWHQYLDDDDSPEVIFKNGVDGEWRDQSNIDANKGIVNNWHEPYEELCAAMAEINLNVYRLAQHFDAKYAAKKAE